MLKIVEQQGKNQNIPTPIILDFLNKSHQVGHMLAAQCMHFSGFYHYFRNGGFSRVSVSPSLLSYIAGLREPPLKTKVDHLGSFTGIPTNNMFNIRPPM